MGNLTIKRFCIGASNRNRSSKRKEGWKKEVEKRKGGSGKSRNMEKTWKGREEKRMKSIPNLERSLNQGW